MGLKHPLKQRLQLIDEGSYKTTKAPNAKFESLNAALIYCSQSKLFFSNYQD